MADFVISGSSGFIGGSLLAKFTSVGAECETYENFRNDTSIAKTFVHCANIMNDADENARLTADILATVGSRVDRFVQLLTFATLHGTGKIDTTRFNAGMSPLLMGPYGHGKLLQELLVCDAQSRIRTLSVELIYLPAVLGGGAWQNNLSQGMAFGVRLPPLMRREARANFVDVNDVSDYLISQQTKRHEGLRRTILNRPESASLTWPDFFRGASVWFDESPKRLVRLSMTLLALAKYRAFMRIHAQPLPTGAFDLRPARIRRVQPPPAPWQTPVAFSGLIEQVLRLQPYIQARVS